MQKQNGLSLVELMISLTLGIVLMTGVVQLFLTSRVTYNTQQGISRIQESGRMATDFLAQDIRMAGYMGCMSRPENITLGVEGASVGDYLYDFSVALEGYSGSNHPLTGLGTASAPVEDSDVLLIRRAGGDGLSIVGPTGSNANLDVAPDADGNCVGDGPVCVGDLAVVADCNQGRVFRVTNVTNIGGGGTRIVHADAGYDPGNIDPQLGNQQFPPGAEVMSVNTIAYYVADSSFAPGVRSLWQRVGDNTPNELIEGVERMKLLYGRDTNDNGAPNRYDEESDISGAQWGQVVAVRAHLLMQSMEANILPEPQTLDFAGELLEGDAVADRRMRQVFTSTIGIRSRLKTPE